MGQRMSSAERMATALSGREADRVPFLLPAILHGARALGLSIQDYFSRAEYVVEGQMRLREKLGHDALLGFMYASQEIEAFGGETLFRTDGPPNAGAPIIRKPQDIEALEPPRFEDCPALIRVLRIISLLKERVGDSVPVMGSVVSPFCLPVMQMGFEAYLVLLYENRTRWERLMAVNEDFTVRWANAQLAAGAGAISYADPLASPAMIPRELYLKTGHPVACRTIKRIRGACAIGLASAPVLPILDDIMQTGTVGVSACEAKTSRSSSDGAAGVWRSWAISMGLRCAGGRRRRRRTE